MTIINIDKQDQNGTTIFNILDNTSTELWMTKYIIGEIFSSGRATLHKNPSDQTVLYLEWTSEYILKFKISRNSDSASDDSLPQELHFSFVGLQS